MKAEKTSPTSILKALQRRKFTYTSLSWARHM